MAEPKLLVGREVWRTIQRLNQSRKSGATVVVSFFGTGGADLLPLRRGDSICVAASRRNVTAGLVNPSELLKYPIGVRVFSIESLHAKVYCFGKRIVLASANVSRGSFGALQEAGVDLVLSNRETVTMLDKFQEKELLSRDALEALAKIYRPPMGAAKRLLQEESVEEIAPYSLEPSRSSRIWYHGTFRKSVASANPFRVALPSLHRLVPGDWYITVFRDGGQRFAATPRLVTGVRSWKGTTEVSFRNGRLLAARPVEELETMVELGAPSVRSRWLVLSDRIQSARIFEFFGLKIPRATRRPKGN